MCIIINAIYIYIYIYIYRPVMSVSLHLHMSHLKCLPKVSTFSCHPIISKSSSLCTKPRWLYQPLQLQLVSLSLLCSIYFQFSDNVYCIYYPFRFLSVLLLDQPKWQDLLFGSFFHFCLLSLGLVVWPRLDDLFVFQNPKKCCVSHLFRRVRCCVYNIYSYGQI